jgi:DNA-binding MarR family transcriptional regulator
MPQESPVSMVESLMNELFRVGAGLAAQLQARTGMTASDMNALRLLDNASQEGVPINKLGRAIGLSSGAASMLVDRLERAGMVERHRDDVDRRRVMVRLSATSAEFADDVLVPLAAAVTAAAQRRSRDELEIVVGFLTDALGAAPEPIG